MVVKMDVAWKRARRSIVLGNCIQETDKATPAQKQAFAEALDDAIENVVGRCLEERKRTRARETRRDLSDESISRLARFTDGLPLEDYDRQLELVPRLVNVVTASLLQLEPLDPGQVILVCVSWQLAEAIPLPGSGVSLPLDLHSIAARTTNSYFAPRRFAAVQLAFSDPRCRVLIFHTGRLVGTGA